jgi:hydrogenase maturation factor
MGKKFPEFFILTLMAVCGTLGLFLHSVYEDVLKDTVFKWLAGPGCPR